jgi:hypothetical protein
VIVPDYAIFIPPPVEPYKFNYPLSFRIVALLIPPSDERVELFKNMLKFSPRSFPILSIETALDPELVFYILILLAPLTF